MNLLGAKVVVIGGAGAIGSHVVDLLIAEGCHVTVIDNFHCGSRSNLENALQSGRVTIEEEDIRDYDTLLQLLHGQDYVFLLAAVRILETNDNPRLSLDVNVVGTFNVLEACVTNKIKKLVYSSSASVFGEPQHLPVDENHPLQTNTAYGASKIAAEQYCTTIYQRYHLPVIGLRYFNVYGPRQDYKGIFTTIIPKWLDALDNNKPITIYGDGTQTMDFVFIKDVARANVCALVSKQDYGFYNIGTGIETSVATLARVMMDVVGKNVEINYIDEDVNVVKRRQCNIVKTQQDIGFRYETVLSEGLQELIDWRQRMVQIEKETNAVNGAI